MEFKRQGSLWLPATPRFVAGGRRQSLLAVTNLSGFGGGDGPPILTVAGGNGLSGSATTIATSGTVTIPAGSLIIVTVGSQSNVTLSSVSDGTNTYVVDDNGTGNPCVAVASCANCAALSGATVTATFSGSAAIRVITVYAITNAALSSPLDKKASATGTSTTPSATTAATTFNNTVVVGVVAMTGTAGFSPDDAAFTNDNEGNSAGVRSHTVHKTINPTTTGAQTYAPTLNASVTWRLLVAAYKGLS